MTPDGVEHLANHARAYERRGRIQCTQFPHVASGNKCPVTGSREDNTSDVLIVFNGLQRSE